MDTRLTVVRVKFARSSPVYVVKVDIPFQLGLQWHTKFGHTTNEGVYLVLLHCFAHMPIGV